MTQQTHQSPDDIERVTEITRNVMQACNDGEARDNEVLPGLFGRIMETAGQYPGKYDPPVSLSTHIINTISTGVKIYTYDQIINHNEPVDFDTLRLLIAALAVHDANKYVNGVTSDAADINTEFNTEEVLEYYFNNDDFGVQNVLPGDTDAEIKTDIADVKWLVQRTENTDTTQGTHGKATQRVRGLEQYCRIADGFVSQTHRDGVISGVNWLTEKPLFNTSIEHVHTLEFTSIEQTILNEELLKSVKDVLRGAGSGDATGVILGTTRDTIVYLGNEIDRDTLQSRTTDMFSNSIFGADNTRDAEKFQPKTGYKAFSYNTLNEIGINLDRKLSSIQNGYVELLQNGTGINREFETVPDSFAQHLPYIVKKLYDDKAYPDCFNGYESLMQLWNDVESSSEYNHNTKKMGFIAELLRRVTGSVDDGYAPETLQNELQEFTDEYTQSLHNALQPGTSIEETVINRFFNGWNTTMELPSADNMCFLCGRPASTDYKPGLYGFYSTNSFSRRVPPEAGTKRICDLCELERALLDDEIDAVDYSSGENIKIAFIYYDEFIAGDIGMQGEHRGAGLVRALSNETPVVEPQLITESFTRQYHLQPLFIDSEHARLKWVSRLLDSYVTRGFKVQLAKPFTGFTPSNALFTDSNPSRRQVRYGADEITTHSELQRVTTLLELLDKIANNSDLDKNRRFTQLNRNSFNEIAALIATNTHSTDVYNTAHTYFTANYSPNKHTTQYMNMRDVAEAGLNLRPRQYSSPSAKMKLVRKAIDETIVGLDKDMPEEKLFEHVSGQVYKLAAADVSNPKFVTTDEAEAFVDALFTYLRENGDFSTDKLSKIRNETANTYLFAYEKLLKEHNNNNDNNTDNNTDAETDSTTNTPTQ